MLSKSYVFDPRPRLPFPVVAKRYWIERRPPPADVHIFRKFREDDLTLVFTHGNGAHKEQWEPTIQRLFENQGKANGRAVRIHDMWTLDLLNRGGSVMLDEEALRLGDDTFSWENYARSVHAILAGIGTGVDVTLSKRRLVLVGHSMGGAVSLLATMYCPLFKISSLHLVEPFVAKGENIQNLLPRLAGMTYKQRDSWHDSEEASQTLKVQPMFRTWDERAVGSFVKHGLRPLPTAEYPDMKEGMALECTEKQEAAACRDCVTPVVAYKHLQHVLKGIPTHITFGTVADCLSDELKQDMLHSASGGISNFASVTTIHGAGHMIVQTHPDALADAIWRCLIQSHQRPKDIGLPKL